MTLRQGRQRGGSSIALVSKAGVSKAGVSKAGVSKAGVSAIAALDEVAVPWPFAPDAEALEIERHRFHDREDRPAGDEIQLGQRAHRNAREEVGAVERDAE